MKYAIDIKQKISNLIEKAKLGSQNEESLSLITLLQHIHYSYVQFEQYYKLLELKYLNSRLKTYLDKEDSTKIKK